MTRLRWDGMENPLGLYTFSPFLSWAVLSGERGQVQSGYQILVASDPRKLEPGKADLWDTGKVESSQSLDVLYRGTELHAGMSGHWTVRVWDRDGRPSGWSRPGWWEMTPVEEEVEGQMISRPRPTAGAPEPGTTPVYLRKSFALAAPVRRARLYASAQGTYEIHLNGRRVGDRVLAPGWFESRRWRRTLFQTYDVTSMLRQGDNVVGAIGGGGWCTVALGGGSPECGSDPPSVMVMLEVTLADGQRRIIITDETWKASGGPIVASHLYDGETYDARLEVPGWDSPGFDDDDWQAAQRYDAHELNSFHDLSPPIEVRGTVKAVGLTEPRPGVYLFDLGQNIVGWARLQVAGRRGTAINLRFGEALNADGTLYTANLRTARATDRYILAGNGLETWEPRFTVHGFRYVELTGTPRRPAQGAIVGRPVHSRMPTTGSLETSSAALNQLYANIVWSQKGAYLGVPTRGPQRDERVGALLDGQLFAPTACLNMDVQGVFRKWIDDIRLSQRNGPAYTVYAPRVSDLEGGPGAADAGVIVPWTSVLCYADRRVTDMLLPSMARFVDMVRAENPGLLPTRRLGANLGDPLERGPTTDKTLIATASFAHSADLLARVFQFMGPHYDPQRQKYQTLFEEVRRAFGARFVAGDGKLESDTQTAYALAIRFGLLTGPAREAAGKWLVEAIRRAGGHLSTGVVGAAHLLPALSLVGRDDVAYQLLMDETCPSWLCSVKNGATTIWEQFDGWTPEKGFADPASNSFNHHAFGAVGEWLYAAVGGIELDPAAPAGKHLIVRPRPGGGITSARASYDSLYGRTSTDWRLDRKVFRLKLVIPANTSATVTLPFGGRPFEGGRPLSRAPGVRLVSSRPDETVMEVGSGAYDFVALVDRRP